MCVLGDGGWGWEGVDCCTYFVVVVKYNWEWCLGSVFLPNIGSFSKEKFT